MEKDTKGHSGCYRDCKSRYFISSIYSNSSINVIRELGYAVKQRKIIIPVILDDTPYAKSIRLDISNIHQIGFKNDTNTEKELITSIIYASEISKVQ